MSDKKRVDVQKISWQEQLSQVKDEFPLPIPSPQVKKQWKAYSKQLQPTLIRAAAQLRITSDALFNHIRTNRIFPVNGVHQQRLKTLDFIELIKKFDPKTYKYFEYYFQDLIVSEKQKEQKQFLLKELQKKIKVDRNKRAAITPPAVSRSFRIPYLPPPPISQRLEIPWNDVVFNDYTITIKFDVNYSKPYPIAESRKSFKFLKKYLLGLKLKPLSVLLAGNEIKEIENLDQLKNIVTILKVRNEFIEHFEKDKTVQVKSILDLIENLPSTFLTEIAKSAADQTECITYLSRQRDLRYKLAPAYEVIANGHSIVTEETFVFTIVREEVLFLVWESTLHGRATYLFATDEQSYEEALQSIYDYIASHQKAKRMKLRKKDLQVGDFNCVAYVTHSSFEHWREKLDAACTNYINQMNRVQPKHDD